MERRAGIVEGCGRVRGIASKLRFIWIGLFIAGCHEYLSTRPSPEVRFFSLPPLVYKKLFPRLAPFPSANTTMDGSREYDLFVRQQPKQARMCGVGGTSLYHFFFFFF